MGTVVSILIKEGAILIFFNQIRNIQDVLLCEMCLAVEGVCILG